MMCTVCVQCTVTGNNVSLPLSPSATSLCDTLPSAWNTSPCSHNGVLYYLCMMSEPLCCCFFVLFLLSSSFLALCRSGLFIRRWSLGWHVEDNVALIAIQVLDPFKHHYHILKKNTRSPAAHTNTHKLLIQIAANRLAVIINKHGGLILFALSLLFHWASQGNYQVLDC